MDQRTASFRIFRLALHRKKSSCFVWIPIVPAFTGLKDIERQVTGKGFPFWRHWRERKFWLGASFHDKHNLPEHRSWESSHTCSGSQFLILVPQVDIRIFTTAIGAHHGVSQRVRPSTQGDSWIFVNASFFDHFLFPSIKGVFLGVLQTTTNPWQSIEILGNLPHLPQFLFDWGQNGYVVFDAPSGFNFDATCTARDLPE